MLEHERVSDFIKETALLYPDAVFVVTGDLLNVFPEPGEDLRGSIFHEIYGDMIIEAMNDLVKTRFQSIKDSPFLEPLYQMFAPTGKNFDWACSIARKRYQKLFTKLKIILEKFVNLKFLFIPGNMDYPYLSAIEIAKNPLFLQLDNAVFKKDGVQIGGLGGIPNTAHPFRNVIEISPYEMHEAEYERRLNLLSGVDVLLTHLSPNEYPGLKKFLQTTSVKLLICRAPFNFNRDVDFRGELKIQTNEGKSVIMVRPFDFPCNHFFKVTLKADQLNPPLLSFHRWHAA
ncbi:hypothetical protein FJ364_03130 [Candidatus Dependentiae bacterium]|nr:hypothetical protein [Candidatus Dependentiae bacterium]